MGKSLSPETMAEFFFWGNFKNRDFSIFSKVQVCTMGVHAMTFLKVYGFIEIFLELYMLAG